MKILMVLTSHDRLGNTGKPTGFWLEEFAAPYYVFKDAGAEVTLASPKGGQPPIDPKSDDQPARLQRWGGSRTPRRQESIGKYFEARWSQTGGLRRGVLSGRTRSDVGPRQ